MSDEQVMVIERKTLEKSGLFQGFQSENVLESASILLDPGAAFWMLRSAAEVDANFKQLIPYCVFRCGDRILNYTRGKSGGESRLHSQISVGVGGHVNPIDGNFYDAVAREIAEEIELPFEDYTFEIIGFLNDDSNEVGSVHLGVVAIVDISTEDVKSREDALANLEFNSLKELRGEKYERLETWSKFVVDFLSGKD